MRAVNLIPSEQRSGGAVVGAGRSGGIAYGVLGVIAAFAVLALVYGMASRQVSSRKSEVASLEARATAAQNQVAQLAPYAQFIAMRKTRMAAVEQLVDSRFDWAHTFHELGRVLPSTVSVTGVTGTVGAAPASSSSSTSTSSTSSSSSASTPGSPTTGTSSVSSATPPGSVPTFNITGCAARQDTVAQAMNRIRLINGVASVELVSSTKPGTGASSGAAGGGCGKAPTFTINVNFQALPTTTAAAAAATTQTVAATSAPGVGTGSGPTGSTSSPATGSTTAPATGASR